MTDGKEKTVFREFAKYASLNVLGMIGLSCYILADTYFISAGLGADGLTALNLAIPVYSFIHGSGLMIGMGGGARFSIQKGQKKFSETEKTFTTAVKTALIFAAFFMLMGVFFVEKITGLLGADEEVFLMTGTYLRVILLFSPAYLMNNVLLCFVRNDGAPQRAMAAMLGGSFSNIILDWIFIFPCGMGIFGAVLATGFAPVISMLILSPFFFKKQNTFHLNRRRMEWREAGRILGMGLPSLLTEVSSGVVIIVYNVLVMRLTGNVGVAAYGVIANISLVVLAVYTGIAQGVQPVISRSYGMGQKQKIRKIMKYAMASTLLFSVLIYLGIYAGNMQIVGIFNSEGDAVLQKIAEQGMILYFVGCPFAGMNILISMYFTAVEKPVPGQVLSLLRGFVVIIPAAVLFAGLWQMNGVWSSFPVTEAVVAVTAMIFLLKM